MWNPQRLLGTHSVMSRFAPKTSRVREPVSHWLRIVHGGLLLLRALFLTLAFVTLFRFLFGPLGTVITSGEIIIRGIPVVSTFFVSIVLSSVLSLVDSATPERIADWRTVVSCILVGIVAALVYAVYANLIP